jgi:hypothetical protein
MLHLWRQSSDLMLASHGLASLIIQFERVGHGEAAAILHGTLARSFDINSFVADLPEAVRRIRGALGEARFDAANSRGAAMTLREVSEYALAQIDQVLVTDKSAEAGDRSH